MTIREAMEQIAKDNGVVLSPIADKILKIKERAEDIYQCPCYPNDKEHWCMSPLCYNECQTKGRCHCGLFNKVTEDNKE